MIAYFQKGFNYEQDGPGNRLVYHLQGCNMSCPWCSNPEGLMPPIGFIKQNSNNRCNSRSFDVTLPVELENTNSNDSAISLSYKVISKESLVNDILSCKSLFFDGGGVTFTGGEATLQFHALKELLVTLKEKGIHTAIETNGTHPDLEKLFPWIDFLIVDCKQINCENHKKVTGLSNKRILENIKKAAKNHQKVLVRITLIHGFNTSKKDLNDFVNFAKEVLALGSGKNVQFEVLTYHEYGKMKWRASGKEYKIKNGFVPKEILDGLKERFVEEGIPFVATSQIL